MQYLRLKPEMVIRTWNLFHGNADPPQRRGYLREMIELVTADHPDVVCLQEVPGWATHRLHGWSGMACFPAVARRPRIAGPLGRWLTAVNLGLFRSALVGQANAILVSSSHVAHDRGTCQISDPGRERRVAQAIHVDGFGVVANVHATSDWARPEVTHAELHRAQVFAEALATPADVVVIAGDFNLSEPRLEGYSPPGPGIDHVLVRGGRPGPIVVWERERTTRDGVVLSDHPPVERVVL